MKNKIFAFYLALCCVFAPFSAHAFFDEPHPAMRSITIDDNKQQSYVMSERYQSKNQDYTPWGYFILAALALSIVMQRKKRKVVIPWKSVEG